MDVRLFITVFAFCLFGQCLGHGAMYFPNPWWSTSECTENMSPEDCEFSKSIPKDCKGDHCSGSAGLRSWFTNYTKVAERTVEKKFMAKVRSKTAIGLHPWNSPGSAEIVGDGCGVNGGIPNGCIGEDDVFGRCCGGKMGSGKNKKWEVGCGGYVGGKPALEHYREGLFKGHGQKGTTWKRGVPATVIWESSAYHRGGYAYRLCGPVKPGKEWKVNEKCFREGHLKFAGAKTWWYFASSGKKAWNPDNWETHPAVKTNVGTNPEGSEWMMITLPTELVSKEKWAIKDLVEVPESLEPGRYVLSFRWDCQQSPQVWNSCANIDIV